MMIDDFSSTLLSSVPKQIVLMTKLLFHLCEAFPKLK